MVAIIDEAPPSTHPTQEPCLSELSSVFSAFVPSHCYKLTANDAAGNPATLIFFIPPHGLASVLADMASAFGEGRRCVIARELTKVMSHARIMVSKSRQ